MMARVSSSVTVGILGFILCSVCLGQSLTPDCRWVLDDVDHMVTGICQKVVMSPDNVTGCHWFHIHQNQERRFPYVGMLQVVPTTDGGFTAMCIFQREIDGVASNDTFNASFSPEFKVVYHADTIPTTTTISTTTTTPTTSAVSGECDPLLVPCARELVTPTSTDGSATPPNNTTTKSTTTNTTISSMISDNNTNLGLVVGVVAVVAAAVVAVVAAVVVVVRRRKGRTKRNQPSPRTLRGGGGGGGQHPSGPPSVIYLRRSDHPASPLALVPPYFPSLEEHLTIHNPSFPDSPDGPGISNTTTPTTTSTTTTATSTTGPPPPPPPAPPSAASTPSKVKVVRFVEESSERGEEGEETERKMPVHVPRETESPADTFATRRESELLW